MKTRRKNSHQAKRIGRTGENRIASILKTIPNSKLFRNVYIPYGKHTIEIDALLVTPKGLFVIECKSYSGQITGSVRLNLWTQAYKKRGSQSPIRNKFYNPIKQNKTHIDVLCRYLKLPSIKTPYSIIVFTSRAELKKVPPNTSEYAIVQESMLRSHIMHHLSTRKQTFTSVELQRIKQLLNKTPAATTQLKKAHIAQAKKAELKREAIAEKRRQARKRQKKRLFSFEWILFPNITLLSSGIIYRYITLLT